ncbi:MAG: hypothetical protein CMI17_10760 [Opitutaceae bacterium]|nr:hypothetical protein [Opitutaceae bacterium]|tara:strand:+ start:3061 stop:3525 length:465 start_codon:yes stop_codon:yes gene_type:complete
MSVIFKMGKWLKEKLYGCKTCGQCILTHTKLIYAKGLLNGPCGGTLDGKYEVIPKIDCVGVNIELKKKEAKSTKTRLPQEDSLLNTARDVNLLNGKKRETRLRGVYFDPLLCQIMDQEDYGMLSNLIDEFRTQVRALGIGHRPRGVPQFEAIAV